ncbi:MAG: arsenic resistance N-acetyltransferase ArsN2 [Flavisolibacter sp.]
MPITPANPQQFQQALSLLQSNELPVNDLHSGSQLFVLEEKGSITGTIAAEYNFNDALLRSLSVDGSQRGKGSGKNLVAFLEDYLAQQGIGSIYLLTTTAAPFFEKLGYKVIDRTEVPEFIRSTTEFSSVCPSSATVMKKTLS